MIHSPLPREAYKPGGRFKIVGLPPELDGRWSSEHLKNGDIITLSKRPIIKSRQTFTNRENGLLITSPFVLSFSGCWIHPEWVEPCEDNEGDVVALCTCDIVKLMIAGCTCGHLGRTSSDPT